MQKKWMKQESTLLSELNHIQQEIYCILLFINRGVKRVKFNAQLTLLTVWKGERGKIDGMMDVKS